MEVDCPACIPPAQQLASDILLANTAQVGSATHTTYSQLEQGPGLPWASSGGLRTGCLRRDCSTVRASLAVIRTPGLALQGGGWCKHPPPLPHHCQNTDSFVLGPSWELKKSRTRTQLEDRKRSACSTCLPPLTPTRLWFFKVLKPAASSLKHAGSSSCVCRKSHHLPFRVPILDVGVVVAVKTRRCLSPTRDQMPRGSRERLGEGSGLKPGEG